MRSFFILIIFNLFTTYSHAYDVKQIYYGQLKNKATLVVLNDTSKKEVVLNMYIKTSPAVENKYNAGITRVLCCLILNNMVKLDSSYANTMLVFNDEYTQFSFVLPNKEIEIERILSNIYRPILIDSSGINAARKMALESYTFTSNDKIVKNEFEDKINYAMWGDYIFKKAQTDANSSIPSISYKDIKNYHDRYFKSYYTLFVASGKFNAQDKFISINENTIYDESMNSTYIPISTLNIYSNLNTSSQYILVDSNSTTNNNVKISFQLASNYQDKNGYVKATIIELLLNKYKNQLFDSIGIHDFEINTILYKNATTYNLSYTSSSNEIEQFYQFIQILKNLDFSKLLNSSKLIDILKIEINKYSVENKSLHTLESNIVENWSLNHVEDFFTYEKKIKDINISDLVEFHSMFIKNRPFVVSVVKSNVKDDNLLEVDESFLKNTEVYFDYNLSDITHDTEIEKMNKVLQWMLINPNSFLQVNGYADKNEYLKVNSPEIDSFVQKYPKFNLVSSFKGKNTWKRLDIFRALKLCKFLIDNGVNPDRINGSGIILTSDERENMHLNQKVTFTTFLTR